MELKSFPVTDFKLRPDEEPGTFEALVSVFGNVDAIGDVVMPGAFARTLAERGLPPILYSHLWETPPIGVATRARESAEGLLVTGALFVGEDDMHDVARQVYTAMRHGALREFSFGFGINDVEWEEREGQQVRLLKDLDLYEVSVTLVGMNPATRLIAMKEAIRRVEESDDDVRREAPAEQATGLATPPPHIDPRWAELLTALPR